MQSPASVTGSIVRRIRAPAICARAWSVLSKEMGQPKWFEILQAVVAAMAPYARHGVNVNVDFYSGVVYHLLGIKRDLFVPIFAIGRVPRLGGAGARAARKQHPSASAHAL